jgi:hypothetical protein
MREPIQERTQGMAIIQLQKDVVRAGPKDLACGQSGCVTLVSCGHHQQVKQQRDEALSGDHLSHAVHQQMMDTCMTE